MNVKASELSKVNAILHRHGDTKASKSWNRWSESTRRTGDYLERHVNNFTLAIDFRFDRNTGNNYTGGCA